MKAAGHSIFKMMFRLAMPRAKPGSCPQTQIEGTAARSHRHTMHGFRNAKDKPVRKKFALLDAIDLPADPEAEKFPTQHATEKNTPATRPVKTRFRFFIIEPYKHHIPAVLDEGRAISVFPMPCDALPTLINEAIGEKLASGLAAMSAGKKPDPAKSRAERAVGSEPHSIRRWRTPSNVWSAPTEAGKNLVRMA